MSAPLNTLGVPIVNPPGQGFNGMDPNFTVPRLNAAGQWSRAAVNDPARKGFNTSDNPASFIDQLIRREDFPPGPDGDSAYASALQSYLNTPAQVTTGFDQQGASVRQEVAGGVLPNNRTGTQQSVFDAQQAAAATSQGGSSTLANINWAANHPEEALSALMAINPNTGETGFLDDATIRDIVTGLGGITAVNQMIAGEREKMIASGAIPGATSSTGVPAAPAAGNQQPAQSGGNPLLGPSSGGAPPGAQIMETPQQRSGLTADGATFGGPYMAPAGDLPYALPGEWESSTGNVLLGPDGYANRASASLVGDPGVPSLPNRADAGMVGVVREPYQMQQNGEMVPSISNAYQYTQVGNDVYLDVTDPLTGFTHRFTGDVVEAAYTLGGASSFDELVATVGYADAVQMLFGFVNPAPPPPSVTQPQYQPPTGQTVGGPGSVGPVNPGSPAPPTNYFPEPTGPPTNQPAYY